MKFLLIIFLVFILSCPVTLTHVDRDYYWVAIVSHLSIGVFAAQLSNLLDEQVNKVD